MRRRSSTPRWSVRSRILTSILVVSAAGLAIAGATAYLVQREVILGDIEERLVDRYEAARLVVTGEGATAESGELESVLPTQSQFIDSSDALYAVLRYVLPGEHESALGIVDGHARWQPPVAVEFPLNSRSFVERIVAETADGRVHLGVATSAGTTFRYIATAVSVEASPNTAIYVAAIDIDGALVELNSVFRVYTLTALGALLAIGLVGWFVAGRLLRPIRRLNATASRITVTDLGERIPVVGRDDISELTGTVNDMFDRLDESMRTQRQLLDDVRHELKTPLTIVRGHLELVDAGDPDDVASTKALVLDELDRMSDLVDDIAVLAESGVGHPNLVATDIADLTAEIFAKAQVIPDHEWALTGSAQVIAALDAKRVTQAVLQLADNAAKYSDAGTRIEIGSSAAGGLVEFWVADNGPGIPENARARIFERLGRVDTGRGIRGSGLGLPIVVAIAEAHGGRVDLQTSPAGSRFAVIIPAGPAPAIEPEDTP